MGFAKCSQLNSWLELNWAWTLHRNFDWVSSMEMDRSCYFRFCWVCILERRTFLTGLFMNECLAFGYWVSVNLETHYTGLSLFFCSRRHRRCGLARSKYFVGVHSLALNLSHPGGLFFAGCVKNITVAFLCLLLTICRIPCWKQSSGVTLCLGYKEQALCLACPFPEILVQDLPELGSEKIASSSGRKDPILCVPPHN